MLNIYFGQMPEAIYDTSTFFKHTYKDRWITDPLSVEMIHDIDKSEADMIGKHSLKISDNRVKYSFELARNITIIQEKIFTCFRTA